MHTSLKVQAKSALAFLRARASSSAY